MFPSWRYGPDGQSMICQSEDDAPEGWADHPAAVRKAKPKAPEPVAADEAASAATEVAASEGAPEADAKPKTTRGRKAKP